MSDQRLGKVFRLTRDYAGSHAIQLYLGAMFTGMAGLRLIETNQIIGGYWWAILYALTAHLIAAGLVWPESRSLSAATGSVITMVAVGRMLAIAERTAGLDPENTARGLVALLLWGMIVVIGLRWPKLTLDAEVRALLHEAKEPLSERTGSGVV